MEIKFHRLHARNFLSAGQHGLEYQLDQYSTNLIIGKNGHGKSLMIDALCFVLFNRPFRKINKPQLINSINGRHMVAEVEFTAGGTPYKVIRGMKPSIFEIWMDGKLINQTASPDDYQRQLERDILKVNFKTFCQVVILGSATYTPFMQLTAAHRRGVVENILDLEIYAVMGSLIKTQLDESKESMVELGQQIAVIEGQRKTVEQQLSSQDTVDQQLIDQLDQQISSINEELAAKQQTLQTLLDDIMTLQIQYDQQPDYSSKISSLKQMTNEAKDAIKTNQRHIRILCDNEKCPTCEQEITAEFRAESVTAKTTVIDRYTTAVDQIASKIEKIETIQNTKLETMSKINKLNQQVILTKNMIDTTNRGLSSLTAARHSNYSITSLNSTENKKKLKELGKKIKSAEAQLRSVRDTHAMLQLAQSIVRDGGIKAQIIKKYVPKINQLINEYLAHMDFFVTFELNEVFEETIKSRHRDEFSYFSFSEGEKVRINLAILFAWRAIAKMRNSSNISLLIFDEVFDGALDGAGADDFAKLLTTVAETTNVWIISHKTDTMSEKFDNVIEIVKEKNFSTIKQ